MKYYAVIDTNVVVSAMLKKDSIPGKIIDLVNMDVIVPLMKVKYWMNTLMYYLETSLVLRWMKLNMCLNL